MQHVVEYLLALSGEIIGGVGDADFPIPYFLVPDDISLGGADQKGLDFHLGDETAHLLYKEMGNFTSHQIIYRNLYIVLVVGRI